MSSLALIKKIIFLISLLISLSAPGQQSNNLETAQLALLAKISSSQQVLNETQNRISTARRTIANRINLLEEDINHLQQETSAARRLSDEATLSIEQMEQRLESWQAQNIFQENLLGRFKQRFDTNNRPIDTSFNDKIVWLSRFIMEKQASLYPQWQSQQVVMPKGDLQDAQTLSLGPVSWFWQVQNKIGGIISKENELLNELPKVSYAFSHEENQSLNDLYENNVGQIIFDPTLSRALLLVQERESIIDHVNKGGIWTFPILAFAAFALSIALLKTIQLWKLPRIIPNLTEEILQSPQEQLFKDNRGMQAELLSVAQCHPTGQSRDDHLFAKLMECKHKLDYWLGAIAITAAVSPLLGLLGTVSGMIEAFQLMTLFGAGDPGAVSSGISKALVTTELGLIVAIPSLILHAILSRWVKSYFTQLENFGIKLSQIKLYSKESALFGIHSKDEPIIDGLLS